MRAFACPDCSSLVPFEATRCLVSGSELGYSRADRAMRVLHAAAPATGSSAARTRHRPPATGSPHRTARSATAARSPLTPTVLAKLRFVHDLVEAHLPYRTPAEAQTSA